MKTKSFSQKIVSAVVAIIMVIAMIPSVSVLAREYAADVSINGITIQFENEPYSKDDIIFVPLEEICGYLNLSITKEGSTYTVSRMGQLLRMEMGNLVAFLDGKEVVLSTNLEEKNGVAYAPIDVFSAGFGCPVAVSDNKRRADLTPNVYKVLIDENHAAAISAGSPDKDVLAAGTSGTDTLFYNPTNFPEMEKSLFYMIDLSAFAGLNVQKVELVLGLRRGEWDPILRVVRTAPWTKGSITYNMQPIIYEDEYIQKILTVAGDQNISYDITTLANRAKQEGEALGVKVLGVPSPSKMKSNNISFNVQGVKTRRAPYVAVTTEGNYTFPIKADVEENSEDETRYNELALLKGLGVFTESDEFPLDLTEGVQRQEFVKYALRLRNASVQKADGEQFFSDVPIDAPFYNDVMTAHSMGLVAGWQGIAFRPYDEITLGETITILGRMLNYNVFADERGGFTPGYFAAARNGDLYHGAEIENEVLSFKKMFDLLEDALDAKMLNVRSYSSNGNAEYTFDENMTILTEYWDAKKIEGVVAQNEYSNITPGISGKEGLIVIDSKELKLSFESYNQFLGYKVRGWYNGDDELLYLGSLENNVTEINLKDIEAISETASTVSFTYSKDNGKRKSESFSKANVIYNGKSIAQNDVKATLLKADGGSVTIVGDSLAVINAYSTVLVYSVDVNEEIIYDTYEQYDKTLRLSSAEYAFKSSKDEAVLLDEIKNGDVLSVAVSLDGQLVNGFVSNKKEVGAITMLEDGGSEDEVITFGTTAYKTANRVSAWTDSVRIGVNGTFYIDVFGNIVGMTSAQTKDIAGYMLTIEKYGKSALRQGLQAAIVVAGFEEYQVYDLADKVEIDGDKMDDAEKIKKYFRLDKNGIDTGSIITQGIIFNLDNDGKIKDIDTAKLGENEDLETTLYEWTTWPNKFSDTQARYHGNAIDEKFYMYLTDSLAVMQYEENDPTLEDFESITTLAGNTQHNFMQIYTMGPHNPETQIVMLQGKKTSSSVGSSAPPVIVDRVITAFDKDGYEIKKLYYYSSTDRSSVIVPAESESYLTKNYYKVKTASGAMTVGDIITTNNPNMKTLESCTDKAPQLISRGDVVRFDTNAKGELSALEVIYEYETKSINSCSNDITLDSRSENRTMAGYTNFARDNFVRIGTKATTADDEGIWKWYDLSTYKNKLLRYNVNSAGVEVTAATVADVRPFEKAPTDPTGFITQIVYTDPKGCGILVDMARPAGTGFYTLSYALGEYGEAYNGVPQTAVRCNNDGSITLSNETPTGKKDPTRNIAWEFDCWKDKNGNSYAPGDTITLTENTELVAQYNEIELPRYIYLKADSASEAVATFSISKTSGVYQTTVPTVKNSSGSFYFAKTGFGYYNWVDDSGNTYTPGEELALTEDLTLYPNWKSEVTTTATLATEGDMDFVIITDTDGTQTAKDHNELGAGDIAANNNSWFLAKIKIGSGYSLPLTSTDFQIRVYGSNGTGDFYCVPLKATDFEMAKASAGSTLASNLVAPSASGSSLGTKSFKNANYDWSITLDAESFTADHYVGEYIYVAFQVKEAADSACNYRMTSWDNKTSSRDKYKMTVKGLKEN